MDDLENKQVLFRHKETSKNILTGSLAVSLKCKQRSLQRSNGRLDSHIEIRLQNGLHLKVFEHRRR